MAELGLNTVRPYSLASWDSEKKYFDLIVSFDSLGLTSNFLKERPENIKIQCIESKFYIPEGRPIIMIANGSGIAPFKSLIEYLSNQPHEQRSKLYL